MSSEPITGAAEVAEQSGGMPQLDFTTWGNQIFWLVVTMLVTYFVVAKIFVPRVSAVLAERKASVTNDIAAAEELKRKAEEAEAAYDKALAEARAEAQSIAAQARADIQAEVDAATAKAEAEIAAKQAESEKAIAEIRASAVESIQAVATDVTGEIVAAFGAKADAKAIKAAVAARMKG
ncbi:MAG: F0F1 ATP synthase subunit B' [Alphaproteobacteria bacterium]|nr:MAG: F0F1 ATP synthase subunit B' [Alphaproteobacteria bacterium]